MKHVLITGAGSYIGGRMLSHLLQTTEWDVKELDVQQHFAESDFAGWDAVVHVAGLAHQKETAKNAPLYRQVNRDLALRVAGMAKSQGITQLVFLSSMSVYGLTHGRITAATPLAPNTHYGQSKLEAEEGLQRLADEAFRVAVLRPPMVYGPGCRGNYPRLSALARSFSLFPKVKNERSMLYVENLCAFIRRLLESGEGGLFFPQNEQYVCTSALVRQIARCHGRRVLLAPGFGWLIRLLEKRVNAIDKLFGTLTYDQALSVAFADEPQIGFEESVRCTEVGL